MKNVTVLLDRDGVINDDVGYMNIPSKLKLLPQVKEAIKIFNYNAIKTIIITNQSGIGRRVFSISEYIEIKNKLKELLAPQYINDTYYCPHLAEQKCTCRKPSTLMIYQAMNKWKFNNINTFFVGDKKSDLDCAINANIQPILVLTGYGKNTLKEIKNNEFYNKVIIFKNLYAVSNWIISKI